ncbi:MAG: hypothetical protein HXS53_06970 [Theionarchaea archaeon]|nr:hypothetical protein [Theionarchaea archaeon]
MPFIDHFNHALTSMHLICQVLAIALILKKWKGEENERESHTVAIPHEEDHRVHEDVCDVIHCHLFLLECLYNHIHMEMPQIEY